MRRFGATALAAIVTSAVAVGVAATPALAVVTSSLSNARVTAGGTGVATGSVTSDNPQGDLPVELIYTIAADPASTGTLSIREASGALDSGLDFGVSEGHSVAFGFADGAASVPANFSITLEASADASGTWTARVVNPSDNAGLASATITVTAQPTATVATTTTSEPPVTSTTITTTTSTAGGRLPATGSTTGPMVAAAVGTLAAGLAATWLARRRSA